jgi:type IV fimbrial biogenesis protein FimT
MNVAMILPTTPSTARHGFTLVELMITVVVLAVLAAIAVPSMREFIARQRVESIAKELATDLRYLRTQAIQRQLPVQIRFGSNTDTTCYVLFGFGSGSFNCNCARTDGLPACGDPAAAGASTEYKTVSIRRNRGITVSADPFSLDLEGSNGLPRGSQTIRASVAGTSIGGEVRVFTIADDQIVPKLCSVSGHHGSITACTP